MSESVLFKALRAGVKAAAKFQGMVREVYEKGQTGEITACAEAIEQAYPVKKEDGKDANRQARNGLLTALRMALNRTGKEQPEPRRITIKKVEGVWTLVDEAQAAPTPEEGAEEGEEGGIGLDSEEAQEALWAAVELVSKSLHVKAVRVAIADALKKELAKGAKQ